MRSREKAKKGNWGGKKENEREKVCEGRRERIGLNARRNEFGRMSDSGRETSGEVKNDQVKREMMKKGRRKQFRGVEREIIGNERKLEV